MGTVTLAQLKTRARERADMENSGFISDSELVSYINASVAELYDLLVSKYGEDYFVASPYSITTTNNQDTYALPSNLYKLLGVDLQLDTSGNWVSLKRFEFAERNIPQIWDVKFVDFIRYRLFGSNIKFSPVPQSAQSLRLWYIPLPTALANDSDTLDGFNGYEEYVVIDTAIKMLNKEESDSTLLMAEKAAMKLRIEQMAEGRDAGQPSKIQDITSMSSNYYYGVYR